MAMPTLDDGACYRALQTRDARFDGRFFVGVRTTGVYCRPICPARTPRPENCQFLPSAAAAAEAGFRPCLRCRPEASPGTPAWHGTSTTVSRALALIGQGALDEGSVETLAERLGVGDRHLRRLFLEQLGASPLAVAQTRRLLFAKKLLNETRLPISEIAYASGFASIRRFNDAVRRTWDRTPRELRSHGRERPGDGAALRLRLPFRPPYDWEALAAFLGARAIPGVERAGPEGWSRSLRVGDVVGTVEVTPVPGEHHLLATLRLSGPAPIIRLSERLRRLFDLCADPARIAAQLRADPRLAAAVARRPGLRVPGAWDGFELAVRAILGQQVSVKGATTLAGRIAERYGDPLPPALGRSEEPDALRWLFPKPEALVDIEPRAVGLPVARARAIAALAQAVVEGRLDLESAADPDATRARLCALPGIGPWTAEYVAMRALREPDAFPTSDLGLRRALARAGVTPSAQEVERIAERWHPWRAYAALHLWTALGDGTPRTVRSRAVKRAPKSQRRRSTR